MASQDTQAAWKREGHPTLSSCIVAEGAQRVLDFVVEVLGATSLYTMRANDGTNVIQHASLRIGDDSVLMLCDAGKDHPASPVWMYVYVPDVDATYELALSKGAVSVQAPKDEFYGDRRAGVKDAAGNTWWIATHKSVAHA